VVFPPGAGGVAIMDMDDFDMESTDPAVLPNGGEIHFTDDRDPHAPEYVQFLPGGFVKAVYPRQYNIEVYSDHVIEGVYTHTSHLEPDE